MTDHLMIDTETQSSGLHDFKLLQKLWPFMRPHKKDLFGSFLLLPLVALSQMAQPFIVRQAIDHPIAHGDIPGLFIATLIYLIVLSFHYWVRYVQTEVSQEVGQKIIRDLRLALYAHLQTLSLRFFQKNPVGRLMTRVTSDVENLSEMFSSGGLAILQDIAIVLGGALAMLLMQWQLALVAIAMLLVNLVVMEFFRIKSRQAYDQTRLQLAKITTYLNENIAGMELIQLYNREAYNTRYFEKLSHAYYKMRVASVFYSLSFNSVVELLTIITQIAVLWVAGSAILHGEMTLGLLGAFFLMVTMVFEPIENISEKMTILQSGLASIDKVMGLYQQVPEIRDKPDAELSILPPQTTQAARGIRFEQVTFGYDSGFPVLIDVSLDLPAGQSLALVGPTGAGKTTLIKLLMRFYEPQQGKILVDGVDIQHLRLSELRRQLISVQQDDILFSRPIVENITLRPGLFTELTRDEQERVRQAASEMNALSLIEGLPEGFDTLLTERGKNLSAGEKQLVLFSRAVYHQPSVLILDEATAAIDPHTEGLIQDALNRLMHRQTVVMIAHRLATVEKVDQILVLEQGHLIERGSHAELLMNPSGLYKRFYDAQQRQPMG